MKAKNIEWDHGYDEDETLPTEIDIPKEIENDVEAISDYLSDTVGYCHYGFVLTE